MSRDNVELVWRIYKMWAEKQWSAVPDVFDPDVEVDLSRNVFNPGVYRGYAGLESVLRGVGDMWDDFRFVPTEVVAVGDDTVLATVTLSGTGKESGVDVEMEAMTVWTLREGKAVRMVGGYRDRAEALAAARLP
jgi:ketosteroid isomerase-like protein